MPRAVNIVVYNQDRILVLKRSQDETHYQNLWDLPGGSVEDEESLKEAAEREVKEECGLDVRMDDEHFFIFRYDCTPDGEVFGFGAERMGGEVVLSGEHTEFKWVKEEDCKKMDLVPSVEATIRAFFKRK